MQRFFLLNQTSYYPDVFVSISDHHQKKLLILVTKVSDRDRNTNVKTVWFDKKISALDS